MRIAQRTMYRSFITNMNKNLSGYMDSNIQSATQKRINKPSDDPVGMARVLAYRSSIARNEQYISNSKEAAAQLASTGQRADPGVHHSQQDAGKSESDIHRNRHQGKPPARRPRNCASCSASC